MKKEQLLHFIPDQPDENTVKEGHYWGGESTHKIAQKAKLNDIDCKNLLYDLQYLPMPLVESFEIKTKTRTIRYWRRTKPNAELIKQYLLIPAKDRSNKEHDYLIKFKFYGNFRDYFKEVLNGEQ